MPTWNRLLPQRNWPARSSCDESLFQVYWSRSKRDQAAQQEHRQADVRIDAEERSCAGIGHDGAPVRALGGVGPWCRTMWIGCGWPGAALALRRAAVEDRRLGPALVDRLRRRRPATACGLLAGELEQRAEHAGVAAVARCRSALKSALQDVRRSRRGSARASRGGCVEANSSTTGR